MRIGLYGMPSAGKTCILDRIDFMETAAGSALLRGIDPEFDQMDEDGRNSVRKKLLPAEEWLRIPESGSRLSRRWI